MGKKTKPKPKCRRDGHPGFREGCGGMPAREGWGG